MKTAVLDTVHKPVVEKKNFFDIFFTYLVTLMIALPSWALMKIMNRTTVIGKENLRNEQPPYLFVSNHVSILDDAFVGSVVFMPYAFLSYNQIPHHTPESTNFYRGPFWSWVMNHAKCLPLTRGKGIYQPGLQRIIDKLKQSGIVHIYPEGTRTRSGKIGKGKLGVGRIAYATKCKVIPCYHSGLDKVLPIGSRIPRLGKSVRIIVGEPIDLSAYYRKENTPGVWMEISNEMINAISDLKNKLEAS